MLRRSLAILFFAAPLLQAAATPEPKTPDVPPENVTKGTQPSLDSGAEIARKLLDAIVQDAAEPVKPLFFPSAPFAILKDIPKPLGYYAELMKSYENDIHFQHKRVAAYLKKGVAIEFTSFKAGYCKWKDVHTEYNKIPYWSCYRNHFYASAGKDKLTFPIRALINWGKDWFVTHLGRE